MPQVDVDVERRVETARVRGRDLEQRRPIVGEGRNLERHARRGRVDRQRRRVAGVLAPDRNGKPVVAVAEGICDGKGPVSPAIDGGAAGHGAVDGNGHDRSGRTDTHDGRPRVVGKSACDHGTVRVLEAHDGRAVPLRRQRWLELLTPGLLTAGGRRRAEGTTGCGRRKDRRRRPGRGRERVAATRVQKV